jgi:hypothetical protein
MNDAFEIVKEVEEIFTKLNIFIYYYELDASECTIRIIRFS